LRAQLPLASFCSCFPAALILGIPADSDASRKISAPAQTLAAEAFRMGGYRPYADLIEATLVPAHSRRASPPASTANASSGRAPFASATTLGEGFARN